MHDSQYKHLDDRMTIGGSGNDTEWFLVHCVGEHFVLVMNS